MRRRKSFLEAAQEEAARSLADLARDKIGCHPFCQMTIEVRDTHRQVVEAKFVLGNAPDEALGPPQLAPREKTSRSHKQGQRQLTMILVHTKAVSAAKGAEVEINIGAAGCQTPATIAGYSHRSHRVQQYAAHHLTSPLIVS